MGTVTGMISVFEVMSLLGGGSPRAMAEGVSRATIPTMAGMVAAISGIYFSAWLERETEAEVRRTEDLLTYAE
jgi:biopolymer transport protein ExbB